MKNWQKVKLGTLLTESKILSENPNPNNRIRVKLNLLGIEKRPLTRDKKGATKYYTRKAGQFIYGKQNLHKGAFGIIQEELDGFESTSDIPAFDVNDSCYPEWIYYFFRKGNFYLKLESLAKGVGSKRIQPKLIFDLDIYLPTKEEQNKILKTIKNAEFNNQKLLKELQLQEENLSKLRESILLDAINGKLTKDWRDKNEFVEPASKLLNEIIKDKLNSKQSYSNLKNNFKIDLPQTWELCYLSHLISSSYAGKSPQCESRPANLNEWGVIKTTAIQDLFFLENENKALTDTSKVNLEREVKNGDVLLTRAGPTNRVGITTYIMKTRPKLLLSDKTIRLDYFKEYVNGEFLALTLSRGISKDFIDSKKSGMALSQVNISQANLLLTPILICPYKEQLEIVKKVNEFNQYFDEIKQQILKKIEYSFKLIDNTLVSLLGNEMNILSVENIRKKENRNLKREIKFNSKTTNMDLINLLKLNGKLHAEDLWKMSEYYDDKNIGDSIDKFYSDLKGKIEIDKTIKEVSNEKGYIELV